MTAVGVVSRPYATGWRSPVAVGPEFALDEDRFAYVFHSDAEVACLAVSIPLSKHDVAAGDIAGHLVRTFRRNPQTAATSAGSAGSTSGPG